MYLLYLLRYTPIFSHDQIPSFGNTEKAKVTANTNTRTHRPEYPMSNNPSWILLFNLSSISPLYSLPNQLDTITLLTLWRPCKGSLRVRARSQDSPNTIPNFSTVQALRPASLTIRMDSTGAHGHDVILSQEYIGANLRLARFDLL